MQRINKLLLLFLIIKEKELESKVDIIFLIFKKFIKFFNIIFKGFINF
jgi:hypothetical protein